MDFNKIYCLEEDRPHQDREVHLEHQNHPRIHQEALRNQARNANIQKSPIKSESIVDQKVNPQAENDDDKKWHKKNYYSIEINYLVREKKS